MLIQLIYGSTATVGKIDNDELLRILEKSRQNNARRNVTGILLYKGRNFIQVLEGEAEVVDAIYATVKEDPRHHAVMTIIRREISERMFPDWKMGFKDLNDIDPKTLPGYSNYLNEPLNSEDFMLKPGYASTFLSIFKEHMH
ncbi:MAG: BLUF domain-containing protein [Chloroflexota bacterium]